MAFRSLMMLMLTVVACTSACARSHVVRAYHPPCLSTPPPVPAEGMQPDSPEETKYFLEVVAYAWGTWRACRGPDWQPPR